MEEQKKEINEPIIFLDVDGILTYMGYKNNRTNHIDPEKVLLLKEIYNQTNAKIVIISSWKGTGKYNPICYLALIDIIEENGMEVIGGTSIPSKTVGYVKKHISIDEQKNRYQHGTGHAAEIEQYINEYNIKSFVILDDEDHYWKDYGLEKFWVQPSWFENGLKPEHVKQAINILKNFEECKI